MNTPKDKIFLPKDRYRNRRIIDAAKVIPFVTLFFGLMPIIWQSEAAPNNLSTNFLYFVGLWILSIIVQVLITRALSRALDDDNSPRIASEQM